MTCIDTVDSVDQDQAPHGTPKRYRAGCHCQPCRDGWATYNRERRAAQAAPKTSRNQTAKASGPDTDLAGRWDPPSEPRLARQSADLCPQCHVGTNASPRGTTRTCPECGELVTPPTVLAPYQRNTTVAVRQVKSQRERDLEALNLARHKGIMLRELDTLATDDPDSLPEIEWFREQVKAATSAARVDELDALLRETAVIEATVIYEDQAAAPPPAIPANGAAQQWPDLSWISRLAIAPSKPAQWTIPGGAAMLDNALVRLGWRIIPAASGCQISEGAAACRNLTERGIGNYLVCGDHYRNIATVSTP
jgi:hypothetical protein